MSAFTIYDNDGKILSCMFCTLETLKLNIEPDQLYIEGYYSADEYKIVNGAPVEKTSIEKEKPIDMVWTDLRDARDVLLASSDWTQVPDAPVDQAAWAAYRQELRDLPSKTEDPRNPAWPTPPA